MSDAPICDECGEAKTFVDEPLLSGYCGYLCTTEGCPVDG